VISVDTIREEHQMTHVWKTRVSNASLLLAPVATAMLTGPGHIGAANVPAAIAGFGFWGTLSCIACITGFVLGAGTTVAGLAVFLAANPEIAILCVSTCAAVVS
jgi:hypothetical protein